LASGSVILACHHEQNIFKMGGLRKSIPLVYACFLVGGAALSAHRTISGTMAAVNFCDHYSEHRVLDVLADMARRAAVAGGKPSS
ncbi:proton-conducting transporter membrane subunit, partial [Salmonella enterica subsp. enterica serovar Virginia]|nr:proton-conducting transporter membrane subunit [Salmonella enterica subsp. enterica serovar Virginia]